VKGFDELTEYMEAHPEEFSDGKSKKSDILVAGEVDKYPLE
jgi:hypothetical protein